MKNILISCIVLLCSLSALACLGEAQITATIKSIEHSTGLTCKAHISESVDFFATSGVCPLELEEIQAKGIEMGLINGHDCPIEVGMILSGVIVKDANGDLTLE